MHSHVIMNLIIMYRSISTSLPVILRVLAFAMCMHSSTGQNCQGGICENPYEKGCLVTVAEERGETIPSAIIAEGEHKIKMFQERFGDLKLGDGKGPGLGRVCNSNDLGIDGYDKCVMEAEHQYDEVRIAPGNWDSSFYLTWVLQILLSVSKVRICAY